MTDELSHPLHSTEIGADADAAARDTDHRVVFLHGLFGRGKNFSRIAKGLQPEARSLLVDLPNHGRSGWTEGLSYRQLADVVAEHLRGGFAAEGPVDVVGHSMGGKVAMVLALRHPDLVRRLVVLDIAPVDSPSGRGEFQHLLDALAGVDLGSLTRRSEADAALHDPIPQAGVRGFLLQNLRYDDGRFRWEPNLDLLRAELETIMGFPEEEVQGMQFDGPVLWIGAERSDYVQDEDEPAMRVLFPGTLRLTMRGASHWVHSDKPEEIISALRTFLLSD